MDDDYELSPRRATARASSTRAAPALAQSSTSNASQKRPTTKRKRGQDRRPPRVKKYECPRCFRMFDRPCSLVQHERTHTGERPFSCRHCAHAFSTSSNLLRHERKCMVRPGTARLRPQGLYPIVHQSRSSRQRRRRGSSRESDDYDEAEEDSATMSESGELDVVEDGQLDAPSASSAYFQQQPHHPHSSSPPSNPSTSRRSASSASPVEFIHHPTSASASASHPAKNDSSTFPSSSSSAYNNYFPGPLDAGGKKLASTPASVISGGSATLYEPSSQSSSQSDAATVVNADREGSSGATQSQAERNARAVEQVRQRYQQEHQRLQQQLHQTYTPSHTPAPRQDIEFSAGRSTLVGPSTTSTSTASYPKFFTNPGAMSTSLPGSGSGSGSERTDAQNGGESVGPLMVPQEWGPFHHQHQAPAQGNFQHQYAPLPPLPSSNSSPSQKFDVGVPIQQQHQGGGRSFTFAPAPQQMSTVSPSQLSLTPPPHPRMGLHWRTVSSPNVPTRTLTPANLGGVGPMRTMTPMRTATPSPYPYGGRRGALTAYVPSPAPAPIAMETRPVSPLKPSSEYNQFTVDATFDARAQTKSEPRIFVSRSGSLKSPPPGIRTRSLPSASANANSYPQQQTQYQHQQHLTVLAYSAGRSSPSLSPPSSSSQSSSSQSSSPYAPPHRSISSDSLASLAHSIASGSGSNSGSASESLPTPVPAAPMTLAPSSLLHEQDFEGFDYVPGFGQSQFEHESQEAPWY